MNWRTHVMKFQVAEVSVSLEGDPGLERSQVSLRAMIKAVPRERGGVIVELCRVKGRVEEEREHKDEGVPKFLKEVIGEF